MRVNGYLTCLTVVLLAGALFTDAAWAQTRKGAVAQTTSQRDTVVVKKIEGLASAGASRFKAPEYRADFTDSTSVYKDWGRVLVRYETEAEWIDELKFTCFVLVKNPKLNTYVMFTGEFAYVDIPKGKQHVCGIFLRPNLLDRYGNVERVAVEVYSRGELTAVASTPDDPATKWWRTATNVKTIEGLLLDHSQTPFALISNDAYGTLKTK